MTDKIIQGGFFFLIVSTPLMFGSVYSWAYSLMQLVAAFMFLAWLARLYLLGKDTAGGIPNKVLLFPVFLFLALVLLQLLPLPPGILKTLSPKTAAIYETFLADIRPSKALEVSAPSETDPENTGDFETKPPASGDVQESYSDPEGVTGQLLPAPEKIPPDASFSKLSSRSRVSIGNLSISFCRSETRVQALLVLTYFMLFYLLLNYRPEGSARVFFRRIVMCIAFTGVLVAIIGIVQRAFSISSIYGFWKPFHTLRRPFMGPYVNANHFAGYMELTLPIVFALFLGWSSGLKRQSSSSGFVDVLQSQENNKIALGVTGLCILMLALFLSLSRAGVFSFLVSLLLLFFVLTHLEKRFRPEHWKRSRRLWNGSLFVCLLVFALVTPVIFASKMEGPQGLSSAARFPLWRETFHIFKQFPIFGTGLDTFSVVSPVFKTFSDPFLFTHAENDYLQLLAETGLVGFSAAFLFFFLLIRETAKVVSWRFREFDKLAHSAPSTLHPPSKQGTRRFRYENTTTKSQRSTYPLPKANYFLFWGCACSVLSLGIHSFFDFNLHIPANGLLFFLLLALLYRLARLNQPLFSFSSGRHRSGGVRHG